MYYWDLVEDCPRCKKEIEIKEYGDCECPHCGLKYFAEKFFNEDISDYDVEVTWSSFTKESK